MFNFTLLPPDAYDYLNHYSNKHHSPIYTPKKHTIQSYAAQNRAAKKRKK